MATPVIADRHAVDVDWAASGAINLELSPKPYTITRMVIVARPNLTTTTVTGYNDLWDRIITNLSLTGSGRTFFDYRNMRVAYWHSKYALHHLKNYKRPTIPGDNATTLVTQFAYVFHFGVAPRDQFGNDNPFDLTAGIPPSGTGNLTLQGTFAAAAAMGANTTTTDCDLDVYLYGVRPESGDSPAAYMPQAIPQWTMETPTPAATSSSFATAHNIPAGNYLHSMLCMATNGTNAPRDDSVFNSFRLKFSLEGNRDILSYGGQSGAVLDYKAAELLSQLEVGGWPPGDNISTAMTLHTGTVSVPSVLGMSDAGLIWLPVYEYLRFGKGNQYGADLRSINTGDLKLEYGVSDATGITFDVAYRKYAML